MRHDDFEHRLRAALHERAGEVTPDPATWARVRARIDRGRRFGWVAAAAAVAPVLVLVAAVAGLGLLRPAEGPGPVASAPAASPSPAPAAAAPLVQAAAPGLTLTDPAGRLVAPLYTEQEPILAVRARPGAGLDEPTAAFLEGTAPCGTTVAALRAGADPWRFEVAGDCATAPLWSPEGLFVAWLEAGEAGLEFAYTAWNQAEAEPYGPGYVALPVEGAEGVTEARLHDWVWTDGPSATPSGVLVVTATNGEGETEAFEIPISRPETDQFVLALDGPLTPLPGGVGVLAYADGAQERFTTEGPAYALRRAGDGLVLTASTEGAGSVSVAVPGEAVPDAARVWLVASGGTVLLGDGLDRAWRTTFDGTAWAPLDPLPGDVRGADPLAGRPPASP